MSAARVARSAGAERIDQGARLLGDGHAGGARAFEQHVAVDLGRHDDDGRGGILDDIAGQQANLADTVALAQVAELLIGERLDRRGIDSALPGPARLPDSELRHDRFAIPRRSGNQHRAPRRQVFRGLDLEWVEREWLGCQKGGDGLRWRLGRVTSASAGIFGYQRVLPVRMTDARRSCVGDERDRVGA